MPRLIRLLIEYDGTAYSGWQLQKQGEQTIQGTIESAIQKVTGTASRVNAAGRTDAGVHALGQVACFQTDSTIDAAQFTPALNANLPSDIAILKSEEAPEEFHPRHNARGKIYRYTILNRREQSAIMRDRAWQIKQPLNIVAMQRAADHLLGEHDFKSFQASGCSAKHSIRYVYKLAVKQTQADPALIQIDVFATAFLKQMVRNIVGTLVEIGLGMRKAEDMVQIIAAKDRTVAGATAPAKGLALIKIFYPDAPPPPDLLKLIPQSHRVV